MAETMDSQRAVPAAAHWHRPDRRGNLGTAADRLIPERRVPHSLAAAPHRAGAERSAMARNEERDSAEEAWEAEVTKPRRDRQLFRFHEIGEWLARTPGQLKSDRDEAHRIIVDLFDRFQQGEFNQSDVLVQVSDPPYFRTVQSFLDSASNLEQRRARWEDIRNILIVRNLILRRAAFKLYLDHCGLEGAPRVLSELFSTDGDMVPLPSADTADAPAEPEPNVSGSAAEHSAPQQTMVPLPSAETAVTPLPSAEIAVTPLPSAEIAVTPPPNAETAAKPLLSSPPKGAPGRKPGSGAIDDEECLRQMLELLAAGGKAPSVHAAAKAVAATAPEHTRDTLVSRLRKKFANRWGTEPPPPKTWADIARELASNSSAPIIDQ
jgi:hypothetical protein